MTDAPKAEVPEDHLKEKLETGVKPEQVQSAREQAMQIAPESLSQEEEKPVKKTVDADGNRFEIEYEKKASKELNGYYTIDEVKIRMEKPAYDEIGINIEDSVGSRFKSIRQQYDKAAGTITVSFKGYVFLEEREIFLIAAVYERPGKNGTGAAGSKVNEKQLFKIKID
jgi:hypothetical protein